MVAGAARIQVTFQVDADGLLDVAAREQTTGVEATITVKPSYGLTDDEIAKMLEDSFAHAADDMQARALAEAQVEADQIAAATETALASDGDLLDADERAAIDAALAALRRLRDGTDHLALRAAVEALNRATDEFAARRMDRSVVARADRQARRRALGLNARCPKSSSCRMPTSVPRARPSRRSPACRFSTTCSSTASSVEHACEKSCACTTCHVIVREGFDSLPPSSEDEDDLLDRAWGLTPLSRLSCQAIVEDEKLVIEIPKYTINQVKEGR